MKPNPSYARKMRSERARIYAELESSSVGFHELLDGPPLACLATARLWDVLLHVPGVGERKARAICERAQVWPMLELHEMSYVQRESVVEACGH